ncbi:hypothetical protein GLYMA_17G129802v4 [Glycine max]|uniref:Putative inactive purple acid phosphatase 27 n=1 Tax=Glycine soja TaxID=3848 RepID=A0A0B2PXQ9_GLYSO|nr:hypothetical protein GLYMA_17G129802v4 [Glycine max]KAH1118255.1 hypothetical protein GYH30_047134 [Glycine max]KHN14106.1 Putative inactive purple acid phosphatase 27 [Glycine soja]
MKLYRLLSGVLRVKRKCNLLPGTLTFSRNSMCGSPAQTVGWRDHGFIHTSFLKNLWPNLVYTYRLGHLLSDGSYIWSKKYSFKSSPYPGQDSQQRVIIFGDMGKVMFSFSI